MSAIHFGNPCNRCGRAIPPGEDRLLGNDHLRGHVCESCLKQHEGAWTALVEQLNSGEAHDLAYHCADCKISVWERQARFGNTKMFIHRDGDYMYFLCPPCSQKRLEKTLKTDSLRGRLKHLTHAEFYHLAARIHRRRQVERIVKANWYFRERLKRYA